LNYSTDYMLVLEFPNTKVIVC